MRTAIPQASTGGRCVECHRFEAQRSHPVAVVPSMRVPANFPLENGRMTCVTCHDDSGGKAGHDAAIAGQTGLLRTPAGANLCVECHDSAVASRSGQHGSAGGSAHLDSTLRPVRIVNTTAAGRAIDADTANCITCHDGLISASAGFADSMSGRSRMFDIADEHPVGTAYPSVAHRLPDQGQLVAAKSLDHRIRLFDGRIGCNSCHNLYSAEPKLLVMSNTRSRLCLSCHRE